MPPLSGPARWGILPALSAAAGAVAGLTLQAVTRGAAGRDVIAMGAVLGAATAFAVAIAPKAWVAVLLAPPLGLAGAAAVTTLIYRTRIVDVLFGPPSFHLMILLTTAPIVVLHGMRMKRSPSWFAVRLIAGVLAGVATGFTLAEAVHQSQALAFVLFAVVLHVGCAAALEAALRKSR